MPLGYHLICSAPLSAKISFIPPTVAARTPPSEPDVLPPSMPFEVKACALRQRVNVSHCYGVTGLHSRLFDPVLGLKSFFKKTKNLETSYELRGSGDQLCHPSFHSNVFSCLSPDFWLLLELAEQKRAARNSSALKQEHLHWKHKFIFILSPFFLTESSCRHWVYIRGTCLDDKSVPVSFHSPTILPMNPSPCFVPVYLVSSY